MQYVIFVASYKRLKVLATTKCSKEDTTIYQLRLLTIPFDFPFVTVLKSTNIVALPHTLTFTQTRFNSVPFCSVLADVNKIITATLYVLAHYIHSLIHIEAHQQSMIMRNILIDHTAYTYRSKSSKFHIKVLTQI